MPPDLVASLDAELTELADEIGALPHAFRCPGGDRCWCPISDVLGLVQDRRDWLDQRTREGV